jgi:hypothetical protein
MDTVAYDKMDKVIELLELQNEMLLGLVQAQYEKNVQDEELLKKLLGEGAPDTHEESLNAMERIRTGILRGEEER